MKKCGNRLICVYVCSKKYLKKWQIHLVIIILIMMKTLQNIWKHKREFQINIFMVIGIDKFQYVEQFKTWAAAWVFFFVVGSFDSLTFEKG